MEKDKLFNLQLTVQKLEEELSLYRNGTTCGELLEIINEKEADVESLKEKLSSKEETLRKIAKSSADVLAKYDVMAGEKSLLENENLKLATKLNQIEDQFEAAATQSINTIQSHELIIRKLTDAVEEMKRTNGDLQTSLVNKNVLIDQLKVRISSFEHDSTTNKINEEQLSNLRKSISDKDAAIKALKESLSDSDRSIDKLQRRCADLVAEKGEKFKQLDQERQDMINHVQKFRESMTANISQRDEALKRKDDKIKELNFQITVLNQEVKMKSQRLEEGLAERNSYWQCKVSDLEMRLQEMYKGAPALAAAAAGGADGSGAVRHESKVVKSRPLDSEKMLQQQLQHQDNGGSRKILKERTNSADIYFEPADLVKPGVNAAAAVSNAGPTGASRVTRAAVFSVYSDKMP